MRVSAAECHGHWQGLNDAEGGRVLNTTAPPGACGRFAQLLDLSTCNVSEVILVE